MGYCEFCGDGPECVCCDRSPECVACGGATRYTGTLGNLDWFRCRDCGIGMSVERPASPAAVAK